MTTSVSDTFARSADRLVAHFEKQIRDGALCAGSPLPTERQIVEAHGVSRTVAREAILSLSRKGLVTARRGFRPIVAKPSYDLAAEVLSGLIPQLLSQDGGVKNLFEVRIMMETSLVRTATLEATHDHLIRLKDALKCNAEAIDDSEAFYATDVQFHGVLYDIPNNPILPALHRAYTDWLSPHWSKMPRMPSRNLENLAAHTAIYDAIVMRNPDMAEAALRDHLSSAWEQVSSTFEDL